MKMTGKYEKIKPLYALYAVLALVVIAVPFRMYQHLNILESDTGFYRVQDWSIYLMYALSVLAIVVPYALTFLAKNIPASKSPFKKNKFLAVASFVFAGGIVLDVVSSLSTFLINAKSFTNVGLSIMGTMDQAQVPMIIESVFGIFAAIYVIIFGISFIDGRTTYAQYKFLALSPLFWAMSRIVVRFVRKIAYINVSDLMLELFAIAFMMIFLLSFARICAGLANSKAMRTLFASGIVGIFFCTVANLPRLLMVITGNAAALADEYPFALCDFGFAVFAFAYIVNAVKCAQENDNAELLDPEVDVHNEMETDDNFLSE
ncbi:MAG: hypothetical protein IKW45_04555 [Clostridia bacterium]|nr:hypothetical protein [Clostridia bacterium]